MRIFKKALLLVMRGLIEVSIDFWNHFLEWSTNQKIGTWVLRAAFFTGFAVCAYLSKRYETADIENSLAYGTGALFFGFFALTIRVEDFIDARKDDLGYIDDEF